MNDNNNENNAIVTQPQKNVIASLVLAHAAVNASQIVGLPPGGVDALLRDYYLRAANAGVIILINAAIRELGVDAGAGKIIFEDITRQGRRLSMEYYAATGFTRITVDDLIILQNDTPGHERLLPGNWMMHLFELQKSRQARVQWERQTAHNLQREREVTDLLTEI